MGIGVSNEQRAKLHKRVSYAEARSKFSKLTKDEQKNKLWNTPPITTNFRIVSVHRLANRKLEVLKCNWTLSETDGKQVGPEKWEIGDEIEKVKDIQRNSLRYILVNDVDSGSLQNRYNGKPFDFVLGLSRRQYQSLFFPIRPLPTQLSSISSIVAPSKTSANSSTFGAASERKFVGLHEVAG